MKALGKYVLVEQIMSKKKSHIILPESAQEGDKFDFSFKILSLGADCKKDVLKVGDRPIFTKHVVFEQVKVLESNDDGMKCHIIVFEDSIVAIDNEEETLS